MVKKVIKIIPHTRHTEYFVTANWKNLKKDDLTKIMEELRVKAVNIISVTYTGNLKKFAAVSDLFSSYPTTAIGDSSLEKKAGEGGIHIYGVQGGEIRIKYIKEKGETVGVYFENSSGEFLFLSGLGLSKNKCDIGFAEEVRMVYAATNRILARYGFHPKNIYRFWNFMENILGNYAKNYSFFNNARNEYFRKFGITDYPAATGIEAKLPGEGKFSLSLEAMKKKKGSDIKVETMHSDLQCEAWQYKKLGAAKYGPKFSRAKLITHNSEGIKKIFVSGTSSIDRKGRSILCDKNKEKENIEYVISCVDHLLANSGAGFENIVMSRVYTKNGKVRKIFEKIYSEKGWIFPSNFLKTSVCRDNLIFEIECIAAGNKKNID